MTTGTGDGFAIDFVKLLINPRIIYKGNVQGIVVDKITGEPIAGARVEAAGYGNAVTGADGSFELTDIPAGLALVTGSATGYSSGVKQADIIAGETTTDIRIELAKSQAVVFNNKKLQEGDKLVLNNIQFAVNSAALLPAGKAELDKLAMFMKQNTRIEIQLSGHTSAEGSAAGNRELSLKRVRSCKDYLAAKGIDESRIMIRGFGPDRPVAGNDTEANRALNRRVEMEITSL
ncbi:MAG: OmpA family protein [Chitinophagaceae bacterium]|nr:OmpA family protein [Chitinophagaceae bacterium]